MSNARFWFLTAVAAITALVAPGYSLARDVRRCGITIGAKKTGRLVQDVRCGYRCGADPSVRCRLKNDEPYCPLGGSDCRGETIVLEANATLDLNGFDLYAVPHGTSPISCSGTPRGTCTVEGPGVVHAGKSVAFVPNGHDVALKDATIASFYHRSTTDGWLRATNVVLDRCDADLVGVKGVRAKNAWLAVGCGLTSRRNLYLDNVSTGTTLHADATVRGRDVIIRDGGISGNDVFLTRAHDSSGRFIRAQRKLVLRDSAVHSIASGEKPKLVRSTCIQSLRLGTSESWGVCAND